MKFRVVLIEQPARLSYESDYLVVRCSDNQSKIHLSEIHAVVVASQQVYISAYLLGELANHKISLIVSDRKANPVGQFLPLYGSFNSSKRIREQLVWGEVAKKQTWRFIVQEKIRQQAAVLEFAEKLSVAKQLREIAKTVRSADADNREAVAARLYFAALFGEGFTRKLDIPQNAALNYGYAVILGAFNRDIVGKGYLTQCGIHHCSEKNDFNLSCDFMEPFRPVVDRAVFESIEDEFTNTHKHLLQALVSQEVFYKGGHYTLKSVIDRFSSECLRALNADMSADDLAGYEML